MANRSRILDSKPVKLTAASVQKELAQQLNRTEDEAAKYRMLFADSEVGFKDFSMEYF